MFQKDGVGILTGLSPNSQARTITVLCSDHLFSKTKTFFHLATTQKQFQIMYFYKRDGALFFGGGSILDAIASV